MLTRYHAIMLAMARTRPAPSPPRSRAPPSSASPGIDELAAAIRSLRTTDEVTRFLRDLCTRAELEALAHRWQTARLLDEGVPYVEIAERVPTSTATVTRVAQWVRHGAGGYRIALATGEAAMSAFTRAGENGRLTLAVPAKGRMAEPTLRLCADAGLSFEATERSLVVPCANAPVDLLLVRPSDIPEYVQDGVVHLGVTGANLVVEAQADVVTLAELGFARCTLQAAVPNDAPQLAIDELGGLRIATAYPVSTRMLLAERGIEAELVPVSGSVEATPRLGLADAIVDLVSTGSTASANGLRLIGTLLSSQAVLIGGARRRRGAARSRRAAGADALGRRCRASPALRDDERDDRDAARDPGRAAEHGSAHRSCARGGGRHRRSRRRCRRRCLVAAAGAARRRRNLDPRSSDRAARAVRGAGLDDAIAVAAPIVADVRDAWRRGAARVDRALRRAAARRVPRCRRAHRGGAQSRRTSSRRCDR